MSPRYLIEPLTESDAQILSDMLFHAVYVAPGTVPPSRAIVTEPELARYVEDWGRVNDVGLKGIDSRDRKPVGAAWVRLLVGENKGYGYVDDGTPELSIAVLPDYRGRGLGTRLLNALFSLAREHYNAISLSVTKENPAKRLYDRLGFRVVSEQGSSLTMKKDLS